jgi:MFS superfamily sulfate permease-like transporter
MFSLPVPQPAIYFPTPSAPSGNDILIGLLKAGLGQLPLTILNSVIAVSLLASDLFPDKKLETSSIAISVGLMNLIGVWFHSVPYCHGSGGLAAQYRFGARTGVSIIFLGILKILAGIFIGNSLMSLFQQLPNSILGVMLSIAGMQLCSVTYNIGTYESNEKKQEAYMIMILTAATMVGFANDGIGFMIGCIGMLILNLDSMRVKIHEMFKSIKYASADECAVI